MGFAPKDSGTDGGSSEGLASTTLASTRTSWQEEEGTATFEVWDVEPLELPELWTSVERRMARFASPGHSIEGIGSPGAPEAMLYDGGHFTEHGLLQALDVAYNFHQPLRLRPDDIWLLIAMGFSMHINQDAEKFRHLFVSFQGKQEIRIKRDGLLPGRGLANDWLGCRVFEEFGERIREHIGGELCDLLVADFSTTTALDRAVSEMVLMDVTQVYFEYVVEAFCGIPRITLEGTLEDWQNIRQRIEGFTPFDLEWWLEDLRYVLDEFVAAKQGKVNVEFWQRIFRGQHQLTPYNRIEYVEVSGWVHVFFPYLAANQLFKHNRRNTVPWESQAERQRREQRAYKESERPCQECGGLGEGAEDGRDRWWCRRCWRAYDVRRFYWHSVDQRELPAGFRKTPFLWDCKLPLGKVFSCEFIAGFAGCTASEQGVRPQLGFCVLNKGEA